MEGQTIHGYEIISLLGKGGMADVWYAENSIGKASAIKVMHEKYRTKENVKNRFLTEAKAMMRLKNTHIRDVYDHGEIDGLPFIIMEYVEGVTLKEKFLESEIENNLLLKWMDQCLSALKHAHQNGVIHRDIKPSNIFITTDLNVKILDYGIAKVEDEINETQTGQTLGSVRYMSPEQINDPKRVSSATDLYSLGVTFYHAITRRLPYDQITDSNYSVQKKIVEEPLDLTPLDLEWRAIIGNLTNKNPSKRTLPRHTTVILDDETMIDKDEITFTDRAKYTLYPYRKVLKYGAASIGAILLIWILFSKLRLLFSSNSCTDHRTAVIVANFDTLTIDPFANSIVTHLDGYYMDQNYNIRTNQYQQRDVDRYHDYIRENYFLNTCDTSGIFVNGYRNEAKKIFNFYATLSSLRPVQPEYIDSSSLAFANPQNISFDIKDDAKMVAEYIQLVIDVYSSNETAQNIERVLTFLQKYDITEKREKYRKKNSVLGHSYLMIGDNYAAAGNRKKADTYYKKADKFGDKEVRRVAKLNKKESPKVERMMRQDKDLVAILNANRAKQKRVESKFEQFLRKIAAFLDNLFGI